MQCRLAMRVNNKTRHSMDRIQVNTGSEVQTGIRKVCSSEVSAADIDMQMAFYNQLAWVTDAVD